MKDNISDLDWVELDCEIMELRYPEFVQCPLEESITSNRGQEIEGLSEGCVIKLFVECCKMVSAEY